MYSHIILGGTFDRLHRGHEAVLRKAIESAHRVTIGLTSDIYIKIYKGGGVRAFKDRREDLENWLKANDRIGKSKVVLLEDRYEPASTSSEYDSIIVTPENREAAFEINKRRRDKGLSELSLVEVAFVKADDGSPISSTRVRNGDIDRDGHLVMPEVMRKDLQIPLGRIIPDSSVEREIDEKRTRTILTVGDIATKKVLDQGVVPRLSVIDLKVGRKYFQSFDAYRFPKHLRIERLKSGPGFISRDTDGLLDRWRRHNFEPTVIIVDGEEDLIALPVILFAPNNSILYYGQPDEGLVEVLVTDDIRSKAKSLLSSFLK